jgi:hypothetical protein
MTMRLEAFGGDEAAAALLPSRFENVTVVFEQPPAT